MIVTNYLHQDKVLDLIAVQRRNVILQAPTGSGKTRAALYPFLNALLPHTSISGVLPRKCIYAVPMRILAAQFKVEYDRIVADFGREFGSPINVTIQTGDQPEDREFKGDLIFATIDQVLSSFLNAPYGLPQRLANLNVAAIASAYLVFDEIHLFDPDSTLSTTLHMLQLLKGITPFVLMTATFSPQLLRGLAQALDAEIVPCDEQERQHYFNKEVLPSQDKKRYYTLVENTPLSAGQILSVHESRSIAICNTVDHARRLYETLSKQKTADTEILLLHSRLLPEDRQQVEQTVRERFGKDDSSGGSLLLVSTQVIEVGVDITSTRLHTELAPANSIIQRAGRCARYRGETGQVFIYRYAYDEEWNTVDLSDKTEPYMDQKPVVFKTLGAFSARSGQLFTYEDEQVVLSEAHNEKDGEIVEALQQQARTYRDQMFSVMRGSDRVSIQEMIRDVAQQRVTICADPNSLLESPFDAPSFGLHPGTLQKYLKRWLDIKDSSDDIKWAAMYLHEISDARTLQKNESRYEWIKIHTTKTAIGAGLIVVNPALASYHPILGFLPDVATDFNDPTAWQASLPEKAERIDKRRITYRLETYADHIAQVYKAAFEGNGFWKELNDIARRVEQRAGWSAQSIKRAAEIAVLLHDVGKLGQGWQDWVKTYQGKIRGQYDPHQVYAHTQMENDMHREAEKATGRRPTHAVESVAASLPILSSLFEQTPALSVAVCAAVARHHAPYSSELQVARLVKNAAQYISEASTHALAVTPYNSSLNTTDHTLLFKLSRDDLITEIDQYTLPDGTQFSDYLNSNLYDDELSIGLAYWIIVRVLRLADQLGTKRGSEQMRLQVL